MKNLATYYRVSTAKQTVEPQRLELHDYAKSKGWEIKKEYTDIISGTKSSRKGFDQLLADARAGKIDAVMVVKIDRLARSIIHFCKIVEDFDSMGVAIIIPGQSIDTRADNPAARLTMNILASVAVFERELTVERVTAGVRSAQERGVHVGRKKGYGRALPISECRTLLAGGKSIREASRALGVPASTLRWGMRRYAEPQPEGS